MSVIFVPPKFTKDAVLEAIEAAVPLVVVITEGVPVHDTAAFFAAAQASGTTRIIGPNCPASSRRVSRTPASSRPTSPARAGSGWCRSRAR